MNFLQSSREYPPPNFFLVFYLLMGGAHHSMSMEGREKLWESAPSSHYSGPQAWLQAPLPTKASCRPHPNSFPKSTRNFGTPTGDCNSGHLCFSGIAVGRAFLGVPI